jgi:SPP1 family predicted phage head-tail adaptor
MSQIKDKLIGVYEVKAERDMSGNEVKVKRYIHGVNRLHAYVRELSEREKFAAKAAGAEQSIVFKINYNAKIRAGLFIEFRGDTFAVASVDGYEWYERDLTLRATRVKSEVYDYEEYDKVP